MSQIQPWSVDPTVHVDRIHVIESLPADEQSWYYRTGARLFGELQDACSRMPIEVEVVDDADRVRTCGTSREVPCERLTVALRNGRFDFRRR